MRFSFTLVRPCLHTAQAYTTVYASQLARMLEVYPLLALPPNQIHVVDALGGHDLFTAEEFASWMVGREREQWRDAAVTAAESAELAKELQRLAESGGYTRAQANEIDGSQDIMSAEIAARYYGPVDSPLTPISELTALAKAVSPSHYKGYIKDMQWLEAMQYVISEPACFIAAVELQVRKYLDRSGGKDAPLQEFSKALWYLNFVVAYMKNGGPIRVDDIPKILAQ
jgi:hypothetical protein